MKKITKKTIFSVSMYITSALFFLDKSFFIYISIYIATALAIPFAITLAITLAIYTTHYKEARNAEY